ncbi:MAG: response regulator transcription factor, partial [Chloroflexota bacterium]
MCPDSPSADRRSDGLSRVVLSSYQADHLLQQILAAGMLLRSDTRARQDCQHAGTRLALQTLDAVAHEISSLLSDVLSTTTEAVMVIDDEPEMMLATRRAIEYSGLSVISATDGLDALRKLRGAPVDALVLDLVMPGLTGWDVLREIRAVSDLPVIVVSAYQLSEAERLRGFASGADDFLAKPYSPLELAARIRAVLRRETRTGGSARPRSGSFEGRGILVFESAESADEVRDLVSLIETRPLFGSVDLSQVSCLSALEPGSARLPKALVILVEPLPAELDNLNAQWSHASTVAPPVLVVGREGLLSE